MCGGVRSLAASSDLRAAPLRVRRYQSRSRLTVGLLLFASLTLITLDLRSDSSLDGLRKLVSTAVSPLQSGARGVSNPVSGFFDNVAQMWTAVSRANQLEEENRDLRTKLIEQQDTTGRVKAFDRLLQMAGTAGYRIVPAQVIAVSSGSGLTDTISLDVGSKDGVTVDMTVITGDGLVGRVVTVQNQTCTVLLATDSAFRVGVRLAGSDVLGIAAGTGGSNLSLELLDPQAELNVGDIVVARGSAGGRPFVPGVPVGRVRSVQQTPGAITRKAVLTPLAKLQRLDIVGVVLNPPARDPRDSLIPASPTPTSIPTVTVYATEPAPTATSTSTASPTSSR